MTCIVGIEHGNKVYIGGDSAGVAGLSISYRSDSKVWADGPWAFGFTSSFRMGQILRYAFTPPRVDTWDLDRYMATDFIAGVRAALTANGWMRTEMGRESAGTFLVGYRDRLYMVDSDLQIGRTLDGYDAVGCGSDIALGSLWTTTHSDDPKQRAISALTAAAHHSAGVSGPFTVVSSASGHEVYR